MPVKRKGVLKKALLLVVLSSAMVFVLFPFVWMFRTSITPQEDMFTQPLQYIPQHPTLKYYTELPTVSEVFRLFTNSAIVAISTALITLCIAVFAGYAFSRLDFPGRENLMLLILGTNMIPVALLVIPYFMLLRELDRYIPLMNTYQGLVIAYVAYTLPFSTWMLAGYFSQIPKELEDAAMTDGCGRLGSLFRVILPVSAPGVVAAAIFAFITGWTEFLLAYTLMSSPMLTATAGLALLITRYSIEWGSVSAMGILIVIPVLVLFAFLQKYLVAGLTRGAVKG